MYKYITLFGRIKEDLVTEQWNQLSSWRAKSGYIFSANYFVILKLFKTFNYVNTQCI